jgi:hypothetical protein
MEKNEEKSLKTVISGSYRKHLTELMILKKFLETKKINVLSPVGSAAINPGEEFVLLDDDPISDHRILQDSIFGKIRSSSFHTVLNKNGYIGSAALIEIGYALAMGMEILTLEKVTDPNLAPYCRTLKEVFPEIVL